MKFLLLLAGFVGGVAAVRIMSSLDQFRKRVVRSSLFSPCGLGEAMKRLGFVQADPIRSPNYNQMHLNSGLFLP